MVLVALEFKRGSCTNFLFRAGTMVYVADAYSSGFRDLYWVPQSTGCQLGNVVDLSDSNPCMECEALASGHSQEPQLCREQIKDI